MVYLNRRFYITVEEQYFDNIIDITDNFMVSKTQTHRFSDNHDHRENVKYRIECSCGIDNFDRFISYLQQNFNGHIVITY